MRVFERLYAVEIVMREFTRETLAQSFGHGWRKRCIPSDVKEKMKRGIDQERTRAWYRVVPHDSLYYCDFADLKKIVLKRDNWEGAFKRFFHDDSVFEGVLQQLEPIRNRTAHNRLVSENDVESVTAALALLCEKLGHDTVAALLDRAAQTCDIRSMLSSVKEELVAIKAACGEPDCVIPPTQAYEKLRGSGFFDSDFLGPAVQDVEQAYGAVQRIADFPRKRGKGYRLEALMREVQILELLDKARDAIDTLLGGD